MDRHEFRKAKGKGSLFDSQSNNPAGGNQSAIKGDSDRGAEMITSTFKGPSNQHIDVISSPRDNDVILGRGFRYDWHSGNNVFKNTIAEFIPKYNAAPSKIEKSRIVHEVFLEVTAQGRFLKRDEASGGYRIVTDQVAREKISQAIRYKKRRTDGGPPSPRKNRIVLPPLPTSVGPTSIGSSSSACESIPPIGSVEVVLFDDDELESILGPVGKLQWPSTPAELPLDTFEDLIDPGENESVENEAAPTPVVYPSSTELGYAMYPSAEEDIEIEERAASFGRQNRDGIPRRKK
jgi:hypothetical protein